MGWSLIARRMVKQRVQLIRDDFSLLNEEEEERENDGGPVPEIRVF